MSTFLPLSVNYSYAMEGDQMFGLVTLALTFSFNIQTCQLIVDAVDIGDGCPQGELAVFNGNYRESF